MNVKVTGHTLLVVASRRHLCNLSNDLGEKKEGGKKRGSTDGMSMFVLHPKLDRITDRFGREYFGLLRTYMYYGCQSPFVSDVVDIFAKKITATIARGMYESRSVVAPFFSLSFFRGSFTSGFREGERTKIEPKREPQRSRS